MPPFKPTRRALIAGAMSAALLPKARAGSDFPPIGFAKQFARSVKRNQRMGMRVVGAVPTSGGSNQTFASLWTLEGIPDFVRLWYMNDTATAYTVTSAAIAPSSKLNDNWNPCNASGSTDNTLFTQVMCNNGGVDMPPYKQNSGSTKSLTVPANTSGHNSGYDVTPVEVPTDWMPFSALARIDIPTALPLVMCRTYFANGGRVTNPGATGSINALTGRDQGAAYMGSADCATLPITFYFSNYGGGYNTPFTLEYYCRSPGITMLSVGDSLMESLNSTSNMCGMGYRAAIMMSTPSLPVSHINGGWRSQTMADYAANGIAAIQYHKPQIVLILISSRNDPVTAAQQILSWQLVQELIQCTLDNGGIPVLVTPAPWYGTATTPALEAIRLTNIAKAYATGWPVLDQNALIGDGGNPAALQSQYDSGDHIHCSDIGEGLLATNLVNLASPIIGAF